MTKPLIRTYPMPKGCDAATVTMRELRKEDEIAAAVMADAAVRAMPQDQQGSVYITMQVERQESIRQSIVKIDGRRVNVDGVPCTEVDGWTLKSWTALGKFYGALNGIPGDELGKCEAAGIDESDEPAPSEKVAAAGK